MAAIDFPAGTTVGQEVVLAGMTYVWNGQGWTVKPASGGGGGTPVDAYTKAESEANFVNVPGDTMTGPLNINATGTLELTGDFLRLTHPTAGIIAQTALAGGTSIMFGVDTSQCIVGSGKNGLSRWAMALGNPTPESGNNVGSDFSLTAYTDAGTAIAPQLTLNRGNGTLSLRGGVGFSMAANPTAQISADGVSMFFATGSATWLRYGSGMWEVCDGTPISFFRVGDMCFWHNGPAYKPGGGDWATTSDVRIKTVTGDYTQGLAAIAALSPKRYTYKGNDTETLPAHLDSLSGVGERAEPRTDPVTVPYENSPHHFAATTNKEFVGLVAQDVEAAFPEMVTHKTGFIDGQPVTDLRSLDSTALTYALINAVKELSAQNQALTARVTALEGAP